MAGFLYPPTVQQVKRYVRQDSTHDDALIADLILEIDGLLVGWLGTPIVVTEFTDIDRTVTERNYVPPMSMTPRHYPVVTVADQTYGSVTEAVPPVITDIDGTVVDPTTYLVDPLTGIISVLPDAIALTGAPFFFDNGPYTLVYWAGLQCHPEYQLRMDAALRRAAIDWIVDLYQRRSPAAKSENAGGGVSVSWDTDGPLPSRIRTMLAGLRRVNVAP